MSKKLKPRAYTTEEVREMFIRDMWSRLKECLDDKRMSTPQHKLEVFMHSTFAMLDGCSFGLPGFLLIPNPHPDDKEFHIKRGENYFPSKEDISGGCLHGLMYKYKPDSIPDRD